jgi:aspartyl/asparaginyl-tRNA synthetase
MKELVLSGTSEELKSSQAHKVRISLAKSILRMRTSHVLPSQLVAAATLARISLKCTTVKPESTFLETPPSQVGSSLTLSYGPNTAIATTNAALRLIGRLAPATSLSGETDIDAALVDGWLDFGHVSLDLSLQLLQGGATEAAAEFASAKAILDQHLQSRTFLVGHFVTLADIRIALSLYSDVNQGLWKPEQADPSVNLVRWYDTVTNQDWFHSSVKSLGNSTTAASTTTTGAPVGVALNGSPPPVFNNKYRRHRVRIKEVLLNGGVDYLNQSITVAGWARTVRKASSKLLFVEINDGSTGKSLQCVLDAQTTEGFDDCKSSGGAGASFQFVGTVVSSIGEGQVVDLKVTNAVLVGAVYGENMEGTKIGGLLYPIPKKESSLEHLRENAHLRPRTALHAAAMRVRHAMAYATHTFFHQHGFLYIHTPIITGADCEGAGEQFAISTLLDSDHLKVGIELPKHPPAETEVSKSEQKRLAKKKAKEDPNKPTEEIVEGAVDYTKDFFGQRVNLTVSGQLNVETHACALSDVYTFGPTFRAEESRTYRHLSEFWMIEPEIAFGDLSQDIDLAEDYLKYCVTFALENCSDDLEFFEQSKYGEVGLRDRLRNVLDNEFKVSFCDGTVVEDAVSTDKQAS